MSLPPINVTIVDAAGGKQIYCAHLLDLDCDYLDIGVSPKDNYPMPDEKMPGGL